MGDLSYDGPMSNTYHFTIHVTYCMGEEIVSAKGRECTTRAQAQIYAAELAHLHALDNRAVKEMNDSVVVKVWEPSTGARMQAYHNSTQTTSVPWNK